MLGLHAVACYFSRLTRDACLSARLCNVKMCTIGPDRQPGQQLAGQLSSKDQESDARALGRMPGLVSHLFQICIFIYICEYICFRLHLRTSLLSLSFVWYSLIPLVSDLVRSGQIRSDLGRSCGRPSRSRSMSRIHGSDPWIRSMHRFTAPIYGSDLW